MVNVVIECIPIPDGVIEGEPGRLRLSLILRPALAPPNQGFDFLEWPKTVRGLTFQVSVCPPEGTPVPVATDVEPEPLPGDGSELWRSIWDEEAVIDAYLLPDQPSAPEDVQTYSTASLIDFNDALTSTKLATSLASAAYHLSRRRSPGRAAPTLAPGGLRRLMDPENAQSALEDHRALTSRDVFGDVTGGAGLAAAAAAFGSLRPEKKTASANRGETFGKRSITADEETALGNGAFIDIQRHVARASDFLNSPFDHDSFGLPKADGAEGVAPKTISAPRRAILAMDRAFADDVASAAEEEQKETVKERAARYAAALQGHPNLRSHFGLIVDLNVDAAPFLAAGTAQGVGIVTVEPSEHGDGTAPPVVFELDGKHFEPAARDTLRRAADGVLPLKRGLVQLNSSRFRLEALDAVAATLARRTQMEVTEAGLAAGALASELSGDDPNLRTRGLCLLDTQAHKAVAATLKGDHERPAPSISSPLFAEDLVDGYRLSLVDACDEAHAAGRRRVHYRRDAQSAPFEFDDPLERDEGYISSTIRIRQEAGEKEVAVAFETLLTWTGDNIGLSTPDHREMMPDDPAPDPLSHDTVRQPFEARYDFRGAAEGGPVLRYGKRYRVSLRARKLNGSSVRSATKEEVAKAALGDPDDGSLGWRFTACERAPAPDVLVPQKDASSVIEPGGLHRIIVGGAKQTASVQRVLVSPRIGLEQAALHEPLDRRDGGTYALLDVHRRIDLASNGDYKPVEPRPADGDENRRAAGLFRLQSAAQGAGRSNPFYVDPTLRTVGARLRQAGSGEDPASDAGMLSTPAAFWTGEFNQPSPVMLIVSTASEGRSTVSLDTHRHRHVEDDGQSMDMDAIRVAVAKADVLELSVWTNRDVDSVPGKLVQQAVDLAKSVAGLSDIQELDAVKRAEKAAWEALTAGTRMSPLSNVVRFTVEHHVSQPLVAPQFRDFGCARVRDGKDWDDQVANGVYASIVDGQAAMVHGGVAFDRKSTGALWAECVWFDTDPAVARIKTDKVEDDDRLDQDALWSYDPVRRSERLFEISNIPHSTEHLTDLNLTRDESGALRRLSASFNDARARRLFVRLHAVTRFPESYPHLSIEEMTVPSLGDTTWEARLDAARASVGEARARLHDDEREMRELWLPATRPPPRPTMPGNDPWAYIRTTEPTSSPDRSAWTLGHRYVLWFDDWYASGEGEELAVVCRDPQYGPPVSVARSLKGRFSTWGSDMTMGPAPGQGHDEGDVFLRAEDVEGARVISGLVRADPSGADPDTSRSVKLALLKPAFDPGSGRWFCEFSLKNVSTFRAMIRLCLARHQPHAIPGCSLSEVVALDAFALHQPWTFSARRQGRAVVVTASGAAYSQRAPMIDLLQGADEVRERIVDLTSRPVITAELERVHGGGGVAPVAGANAQVVVVRSDDEDAETPRPTEEGHLEWTLRMDVPQEGAGDDLAVRVTVSSRQANSRAAQPGSADGALIDLPEPLTIQIALPR